MSEFSNTQQDSADSNFKSNYISSDDEVSSVNKEWFILRNNNHVGPFTQKKMLEFYHQEFINDYSLIWREGFDDWLPLKKVDPIYQVVKPDEISNMALPDLPDLRLIEMEAQMELSKEIPPPKIKKSHLIDQNKRDQKIDKLSKRIGETVDSLKVTPVQNDTIYESKIDEKTGTVSNSQLLEVSGTRVSLPPLPFDDDFDDSIFENENSESNPATPSEKESRQFIEETTPEIVDSRHNAKWIYNFLMVGLVALFVTIPLFYIVISNRPTLNTINNMSKEGMQRINLATSEMYNEKDVIFNMSLSKDNKLFAGVNRSGRFLVKGLLTPIEKKIAGSYNQPIVISGESVGGLIKFNYEQTKLKSIPVGLYRVNLNLADVGNIGRLYEFLRHLPFFENIPFIKNYQRNFSINQEAWLGPHSIFLTKRYVEDYQREVWENISRPFDGLFQHYETLLSLMDRFNEIFFNATTAKTFEQSKVIFARKYGREIAPILQMIATEGLTEESIKELKLPEDFDNIYREGHLLAQSVSRSVSAAAGDIDLFLSVKKNWNRFIRIEQRNKLSKKLIDFRKKINSAKDSLEKKVEALK